MKKVRSVLVVDDNPGDVEIAKYYLNSSQQYTHVLTASDGQEAIELFKNYESSRQRFPDEFPPLMIILDINMPRMNGFEFLAAYQQLGDEHNLPAVVVMLTSSEYKRDVEQADQHDLVKEYLVKPFTKEHAQKLADSFGVAA